MPQPKLTDAEIVETVKAVEKHGDHGAAGDSLGIDRRTIGDRLREGKRRGITAETVRAADREFEVEDLPEEVDTAEVVLRRKAEFQRRARHDEARRLIDVKVRINGVYGVLHMGDPHVDDPGTDIFAIEKHTELARRTQGLFLATVGDLQNNWIGRLAHLHAEQSTTAKEAWKLVEWMIGAGADKWLYIIGGNHDAWSGTGDPMDWIAANARALYETDGARLQLRSPGGQKVRINARHDFRGHSMWNPVHAPAKAAMMGWRDHILTCGHKHISGYSLLKDPASGLISHIIRVASYKKYDRYAKQLDLPEHNISPAVVTVIDPSKDDENPGKITTFHDVEAGVDFLKWLRNER